MRTGYAGRSAAASAALHSRLAARCSLELSRAFGLVFTLTSLWFGSERTFKDYHPCAGGANLTLQLGRPQLLCYAYDFRRARTARHKLK